MRWRDMRRARLTAALLLSGTWAATAWAQPPANADSTAAPPAGHEAPAVPTAGALRAGIGLVEVRLDDGGKQAPLPFGEIPQDVDINSIVRVQVRSHLLASALGPSRVLAPQQVRELLAASQALRDAAPLMQQAFVSATRLVQLNAQGARDEAQFAALAQQAQTQFAALSLAAGRYRTALEASGAEDLQTRARDFEDARSRAIEAASEPGLPEASKAAIFATLLIDEADWIVAELERRGLEAAQRLRGVALVLYAVSMRDGVAKPQHLEHYDTLPAGVPVPYEKIRAAPSPEDEAAMREIYAEAQAWAGVLEDLRARRTTLGVALRAAAQQAGLDVEPLLAALREARRALRDAHQGAWSTAAQALADSVEQQLRRSPAGSAVHTQLVALQTRAATLLAQVDATRDAASRVAVALGALTSGEFLEGLASAPTSIDGMVLVLRALDAHGKLVADGLGELRQLAATVQALPGQMVDLASEASKLAEAAAQLPEAARAALEASLTQLVAARVDPLRDAVQRVGAEAATLAERAAALFDTSGPAVEAYAAADIETPDTSFHVSGERLKDTHLDLRTLSGRREGDTVVIVAKLYRVHPVASGDGSAGSSGSESAEGFEGSGRLATAMIGEELDSEAQTLRMLRFGFYTAPGGGPAYVASSFRREASGPRIRQFAPMVAWMLRRQGWPEVGDGARPQRAGSPWVVGVGIHTVTLDLDGDNQQEIGVGVAVSAFRDLLQAGYGWDVGLSDRPYWYVGFRLVRIGKGTGIETVGGG